MPDQDKNFGGSLDLDFTKWWPHVKTIHTEAHENPSPSNAVAIFNWMIMGSGIVLVPYTGFQYKTF